MHAKKRLLSAAAVNRSRGLLDMLYTPAELADRLGIDKRMVYVRLISWGLPYTRSDSGRIWIHGLKAREWITSFNGKNGKKGVCGENQGYCFKCNQVVTLVNPHQETQGRRLMLKGVCPDCGKNVSRGDKAK